MLTLYSTVLYSIWTYCDICCVTVQCMDLLRCMCVTVQYMDLLRYMLCYCTVYGLTAMYVCYCTVYGLTAIYVVLLYSIWTYCDICCVTVQYMDLLRCMYFFILIL
jgi:hypothetical protein